MTLSCDMMLTMRRWVRIKQSDQAKWSRFYTQFQELLDSAIAADNAAKMIAEGPFNEKVMHLINDFFRLTRCEVWKELFQGRVSLGLKGRTMSTPERRVKWITDPNSGIGKALAGMAQVGLTKRVIEAMKTGKAKMSDTDIRQWMSAYPEE